MEKAGLFIWYFEFEAPNGISLIMFQDSQCRIYLWQGPGPGWNFRAPQPGGHLNMKVIGMGLPENETGGFSVGFCWKNRKGVIRCGVNFQNKSSFGVNFIIFYWKYAIVVKNVRNACEARKKIKTLRSHFEKRRGSLGVNSSEKRDQWVQDLHQKRRSIDRQMI